MDKSTLRIISKASFILVIMGFFMPIVLNQNIFQVAEYITEFFGDNSVTNSLYAMFLFSCVGCLLFCLLIMKKNFSLIFDWGVIIASIITMLIIFSEIFKVLGSVSDFGSSFGVSGAGKMIWNEISEYVQYGAYAVIFGLVIALVAQIISSILEYKANTTTIGCYKYPNSIATKINSLSSTNKYSAIPSPVPVGEKFNAFNVIANTAIRSGPNEDQYIKKILEVGDKVSFINVFKEKPNWFYVNILNSTDAGWCFAGHLERIF